MTSTAICETFEHAIETLDNAHLEALTSLSADPYFAHEAGEEFMTAVAVVGLHRVLAV